MHVLSGVPSGILSGTYSVFFFWRSFCISSDMLSDILSGISSEFLSGISSDIFSDISPKILSDISSATLSDHLPGSSSDLFSGILCDVLSGIASFLKYLLASFLLTSLATVSYQWTTAFINNLGFVITAASCMVCSKSEMYYAIYIYMYTCALYYHNYKGIQQTKGTCLCNAYYLKTQYTGYHYFKSRSQEGASRTGKYWKSRRIWGIKTPLLYS